MNKRVYKAVAALLGTAALSGQAFAKYYENADLPVGDSSGVLSTATAIYAWDGGNIGFGSIGTVNSTKYPYYPPKQVRVSGVDPMGASSVDEAKNLGWNHTIPWYAFEIKTAGGYTINMDRASSTAGVDFQPAFSVWASGANRWEMPGGSHAFDQVSGPVGLNAGGTLVSDKPEERKFMVVPPEYGASITGFVGYANSGPGYVNAAGSNVLGALAFGSSTLGPLVDPAKPYDSSTNLYTSVVAKGAFIDPHAGRIEAPYAGVGSSVNTSNPALPNEAGGGHVDLRLWLKPGWYAMAMGGSCADFTCTPNVTGNGRFHVTIMPNAEVTPPIPVASGGADQANPLELSKVNLHGGGIDPKGTDISSYRWRQVSGPVVTLVNPASPTPSFIAPLVDTGKTVTVGLELVVTDSSADCNGGPCSSLPTTVDVVVGNDPSVIDCSAAVPSKPSLWPAKKKMAAVTIGGITGTKPYSLTITGVTSDEPVKDKAAKDTTAPDAVIKKGKATKAKPSAVDSVQLRAERQAKANGRVYAVNFQANDGSQTCTGSVKVEVPLVAGSQAVDDGQVNDATQKKK